MSPRLGPIQNTHLFFDEDGNESHRCVLVFDDEQEMIRFNLPDSNDDYESTDISEVDEEDDNSLQYESEGEGELTDELPIFWSPIYLPKINYRFLIRHPVVLLKFINFIHEYNKSITLEFKEKATADGAQLFLIPRIPPHIVEHLVNHYQHLNPSHPHRQFLRYSAEDENYVCGYVKALTDSSSEFTPSENTWDIKDEGAMYDAWNPVYMPQMNFKFIAYHPRIIAEYFHFINTYNVFHHPNNAYRIKLMPSYAIQCILAHEDIANNNTKFFNRDNDINFLCGMLERLDEDNQDTGSQYDDYETSCPEQAAFDKEFFGY